MRAARWMTGSLIGIALVGASVSAEARPRHGGGWGGGWGDRGHHRHHRGDGFGVGDAIGIAALVGAVAIVASSVAKDRKARDVQSGPGGSADSAPDARPADDFSDMAADDAITDACALAARDEAQADGGYAEIRRIDPPRATPRGQDIDGEVEVRPSWRASDGNTRRFTCTVADGRVTDVYLSRDVAGR